MDKRAERQQRADRLRQARETAGFTSPFAAADHFEWKRETYKAHEVGRNGFEVDAGREYARGFGVSLAWLMTGEGEQALAPTAVISAEADQPAEVRLPKPDASFPMPIEKSGRLLPVYGQAAGGMEEDGKFILNGQKLADVYCPPSLANVVGAYAVYHSGYSMIPRYEPGELLTINPAVPVRSGDYVLVQIRADDGEPPYGYVKKFISRNSRELVLEQLNPPDGESHTVRFPNKRVIAVHAVWSSGRG